MQKLRIGLIGYGKMGQAIEKEALARGHEIKLRLKAENANWTERPEDYLKDLDLAIEFTQPKAALGNLEACFKFGLPVVCGTTAWQETQGLAVEKLLLEHGGRLLASPNFSLGVNLFFKLEAELVKLMRAWGGDYGAEIEETHHKHKLDAPSGTAVQMVKLLQGLEPRYKDWRLVAAEDLGAFDAVSTLPVVAHREDEVAGTHVLRYRSAIDAIEIKHTAFERRGFALGAVLGAEWLYGREQSGWYDMNDVLWSSAGV